ncbi:MAG: aminoacetone oxidase family FAD-binding enzyme [Bacilli bacterium]|nr:aminoacetone oxidase family FAD-binding enzyme [Bacilli bacterium]
MTVAVIGGGAAGLVAAIYASKNNKVILIEKNEQCAKKILVTGNGKCNYWNTDQNISHYHSRNMDLIESLNTENNRQEILSFFEKIGIVPLIKNGYYYPYSGTATSIKTALMLEVKKQNIEIKNNYFVKDIKKENDQFIISDGNEIISVDKVILATGSLAYYKDDSANIGYNIAKKFGHEIVKILPSLVQLQGNEKYFKDWMGIRCNSIVNLYQDNDYIKSEEGEILLTDYGISGICVFNISGIAARLLDDGHDVFVNINFVPWYKGNNFVNWLDERSTYIGERKLDEFLEGFLNYKLAHVILKVSNIDKNKSWNELSLSEKNMLANNFINFSLKITGTNSFDKAQVCSGGVNTLEINKDTMESLIVPGLYFAGEIIDVDGDCGGYNLGFAFLSGMTAGINVGDLRD